MPVEKAHYLSVKRRDLPREKDINIEDEGAAFYSWFKGNLVYVLDDPCSVSDHSDIQDSCSGLLDDSVTILQLCQKIRVLCVTKDLDGKGISRVIEFESRVKPEEKIRAIFSESQLIMKKKWVVTALIDSGLKVYRNEAVNTVVHHICEFILEEKPEEERITCTTSWLGWCEGIGSKYFVLPEQSYELGKGEISKAVIFNNERGILKNQFHPPYSRSEETGDPVKNWIDAIGRHAVGNSRLALTISAGFASVLLIPLGIMGAGFHLAGESSSGKTICCDLASGLWGFPIDHRLTWDGSGSGLEQACSARSGQLAVLDEMGQILPADLGRIIYKVAHGSPKMRMTNSSKNVYGVRKWTVLVLSSGEKGGNFLS